MPLTDPFGPIPPLLETSDLDQALLYQDSHYYVFDKPGWIVCHPSKNGPLSSLAGAVREVYQQERVHLVSRLDRETSGLVIFARHRLAARHAQMAFEQQAVQKTYLCLLEGCLTENLRIDLPLGEDPNGPVRSKMRPLPHGGGQAARTEFLPISHGQRFTLCQALPTFGRKHQIRAHAAAAGYPVAGDKLYGPDPHLFLEFASSGWNETLASQLPLKRHALHCFALRSEIPTFTCNLQAPFPQDWLDLILQDQLILPGHLLQTPNSQLIHFSRPLGSET
ncbi:MAG: RluA family pseudouridine synthase [Puniceicoccaceae bacterium]